MLVQGVMKLITSWDLSNAVRRIFSNQPAVFLTLVEYLSKKSPEPYYLIRFGT